MLLASANEELSCSSAVTLNESNTAIAWSTSTAKLAMFK